MDTSDTTGSQETKVFYFLGCYCNTIFVQKTTDGYCSGCFSCHLPHPDMMLCKHKTLKVRERKPIWPYKLNGVPIWPYRLRGGADRQTSSNVTIEQSLMNLEESISPMVERAIQNAEIHGINIHHGVRNLANGDCAFETVLDSINTRPCFGETFQGTPAYWRNKWMSEIEEIAFAE